MYFQDLILTLQRYWGERGCLLIQPYDVEKGAATFNPATFLRALGPEPFRVAWPEPCRRPTDGRYGENPIRMQHYYQFQVILKPSPLDILDLYFGSLKAIGITADQHDLRLVHDDWESPTLGAWGLGWEVWLDGMEVTQFTYFQQVGGLDLSPITGEITYGLERLCMFLQGVDNVFALQYNAQLTYGDVFHQNEVQHSRYNFELADVTLHREMFQRFETECARLCENGAPLPAADYCLKASHAFNLLDARGAISVNERQAYILRVRTLARAVASAWLTNRESLGFPLLKGTAAETVKTPAAPAATAVTGPARQPLLIELGVEEMPAQVFASLLNQLPALFAKHVGGLDLAPDDVAFYVTPRRIAISVGSLATRQPDKLLELKGPPVRVARDANGNWTKAAEGFARKNGLDLASCEIREIGGAEYLYAEQKKSGQPAVEVLAQAIPAFFNAIHWYKTMRWGGGQDAFVRPVVWLVALLGDTVIPCTYAGIASGAESRGHRFLAPRPVKVSAERAGYLAALREAKVIVDQTERRATIHRLVTETAAAEGLAWRQDDALLDEVTYLVEYPVPVLCAFPAEFLDVPELVLVSEMREHQKQLALVNADGKLANRFIGISNQQCADYTHVRTGYQNVIGSRFADAKFFLREDQKRPLESRVAKLAGVVFQEQLGTIHDKVERLVKLTAWLGERLGLSPERRAHAAAIARLCKADLTTLMVGEFPELQGEVGAYYAHREGLPPVVADGIRDHYLPRGVADQLPGSDEAAIVGIADRIDSLCGIFGIGKAPTASSDPFALRRACLGTIAVIVSRGFHLEIRSLIEASLAVYGDRLAGDREKLTGDIMAFYQERARRLFAESERSGVPGPFARDTIAAVMQASAPWDDFTDLVERLQAMEQFRQRADFADVAATFKRTSNILVPTDRPVDPAALTTDAERELLRAVEAAETAIAAKLGARDYVGALALVGPLRETVDRFFEAVMVNDPDAAIRANRQALVQRVVALVMRVADFAQIQ